MISAEQVTLLMTEIVKVYSGAVSGKVIEKISEYIDTGSNDVMKSLAPVRKYDETKIPILLNELQQSILIFE